MLVGVDQQIVRFADGRRHWRFLEQLPKQHNRLLMTGEPVEPSMEYIVKETAADTAKAQSPAAAIEKLISRLQDTTELLEPGVKIKRKLTNIRTQIKKNLITNETIEDYNQQFVMGIGSWKEQTECTYMLACIYTAIAQIHLHNGDTASTMMSIMEASSFYGFAAGLSHPRRISEQKRAIAGGKKKALIQKQKLDQAIYLLQYQKTNTKHSNARAAAKEIAALYQKFCGLELGIPQGPIENTIEELTKLIEKNNLI